MTYQFIIPRQCRRAFVACLCWAFLAGAMRAADGWTPLWNGRDLSGWTSWLDTPQPTSVVPGMGKGPDGKYHSALGLDRDPLRVFSVVSFDGQPAIRVSGEVFGELRYGATLTNYRLRLQFKWGQLKWPPRDKSDTPRDSGLFYHVHTAPGTEGRLWSRGIEFQIQEHDVGDLYAVGSMIAVRSRLRTGTGGPKSPEFQYDPKGGWNFFSQVAGSPGRCIKQSDHEKPTGEWNTLELICVGEECIHVVNGVVVMRLHGPTRIDTAVPQLVTQGQILLQSEGAEVFYRAIEYQPIAVLPSEYAEQ